MHIVFTMIAPNTYRDDRRSYYFPRPSWKNYFKIVNILQTVNLVGFSFKYCEPSYTIDSVAWLIEYSVPRGGTKSILSHFHSQFTSRFDVTILRCSYNGRDRVSVICRSLGSDQFTKRGKTVSTIDRSSVSHVSDVRGPSSRPSFKLSGHISTYVKSPEEERDAPVDCIQLPPKLQDQVRKYSNHVRTKDGKTVLSTRSQVDELGSNKVEFVSGGTLLPAVTEEKQRSHQGRDSAKDSECLREHQAAQNRQHIPPIALLTANSRNYAINRLINDARIFEMVRTFLAYVGRGSERIVSDGDTRLSLGLKIKMEGLPLGEDLLSMYYEGLERRGFTRAEANADLEAYYAYLVSKRMQHLANAQIATNRYYGLKGGSQVIISSPLETVTTSKGIEARLDGSVVNRIG